ncbi:MAG: hypothetical protein RQ899_05135 [Pseudomonadales bacterium]|nr:hypothetical protein [Pseudomonadales bacterium]
MTKKNIFFWFVYIEFVMLTTAFLYSRGVFESISFGASVILLVAYALVAFFIKLWIRTDFDNLDDYFRKSPRD